MKMAANVAALTSFEAGEIRQRRMIEIVMDRRTLTMRRGRNMVRRLMLGWMKVRLG